MGSSILFLVLLAANTEHNKGKFHYEVSPHNGVSIKVLHTGYIDPPKPYIPPVWSDEGNVRRGNDHYYYSDWFINGEREHDKKYGKYKECGDPNCIYCVGQYIVN